MENFLTVLPKCLSLKYVNKQRESEGRVLVTKYHIISEY